MAVPERTRWPDERIDDFAAEVHMLKAMPIRIASLTEQTTGMRRDIDRLATVIESIDGRLDTVLGMVGQEQAEHRGENRASERQADKSHKWHTRATGWLQTAALVAAVVVAATSLVVSLAHA